MTTLHIATSISRSPLRCGFFILSIALCCFALSSALQAVNPPPDGGYGGQNTAEGTDALFSLTSGVWNVAVGFQALHSDTTGNQNTAVGYKALFSNISGDKSTAYGSLALFNNTTGTENVATGFSTLSPILLATETPVMDIERFCSTTPTITRPSDGTRFLTIGLASKIRPSVPERSFTAPAAR